MKKINYRKVPATVQDIYQSIVNKCECDGVGLIEFFRKIGVHHSNLYRMRDGNDISYEKALDIYDKYVR